MQSSRASNDLRVLKAVGGMVKGLFEGFEVNFDQSGDCDEKVEKLVSS